ncbi:HAD family acid phosphatase [Streptomyces sp. V3I7]|uniref:HAD family acid phosphatase n=1 Tax=Streptomyces sp. V3I7 TaxID=3042278 RepID=UPI002783D2C7|nr:HAD family acid phosphatase [Streptomyces sp. V3I7]MDQ0992273.1 putative secreted acid phosphatase [Streptomyces sp. V3I7]
MTRQHLWARRISVTAVSVAALAALATPADAATTATATATGATTAATTSSTAAEVDYTTWQMDCQTVMAQALPGLKDRIAATEPGEKQAIVFDIDNTTLETDFGFSYPQPANKPVLDVAKYAQEHGVSLFFVTARPGIIYAPTKYNLEYDGYDVTELRVRGLFDLFKNVADYKTAQRADIESDGYTIIANIGNSATDLSGGHAEKTVKLPDYDGQLS